MSTGAVVSVEQVGELSKKLGKKKEFLATVDDLRALVDASADHAPPVQEAVFKAVKRVAVLLRSRYTSPSAWERGRRLFRATQNSVLVLSSAATQNSVLVLSSAATAAASASASDTPTERGEVVCEWLKEADTILADVTGLDTDASSSPQTNSSTTTAANNTTTTTTTTNNNNNNNDNNESTDDNTVPGAANILDTLQSLLQGQGGADGAQAQASLQAALDAMVSDTAATGMTNPEAASARARDDLTFRIVRENDRWAQRTCAVCLSAIYQRGQPARAKEMPCKHVFHEECLIEWLEKKNTCPTCRHQLPRDTTLQDMNDMCVRIQETDPTSTSLYA